MTYILVVLLQIMFAGCDSLNLDESADKVETVTLYVSAETGSMMGMTEIAYECMLVKEKGQTSWNPWEFGGIKGFTYEKGYDYELLVKKTTYADPPADGSSYGYELIRVVSKVSADIP